MNNAEKKSLGKIKHISLDLSEPLPFKELEMPLNSLTLLIGQNGVGKSFINVVIFIFSVLVNIDIMKQAISNAIIDDIFSKCFDNKVVGTLKAEYVSGVKIEIITGEDGKVISHSIIGTTDILPTLPLYLSSNFRLFSSIKGYLLARKFASGNSELEKLETISSAFKLYDIMMIERLIKNCPFKFTPELIDSLEAITESKGETTDVFSNIKSIDVDLEVCDFILTYNDETKKSAAALGNGHQAVLNMFLNISIQ